MLLSSQIRKSIRRFAKHQSKHPNVIPHPNGMGFTTLPRGFRPSSSAASSSKLSTSLSNSHISKMTIIKEDQPSTSASTTSTCLSISPVKQHKSEPNSPNFIRKSTSYDEERLLMIKDQRHTWPLTVYDLRRPMNVLISGERDGIDYLRVIINMYLPEYRKANSNGSLPPLLMGKEKEIFGNIEEIYEFHQHFAKELELYQNNPTDVGCAFVNNIQRLRDIYCEYTINKEQNASLHHESETVTFFTHILHTYSGNNNEKSKPYNRHLDLDYYKQKNMNVNLDSILMWPVQRLFKYSLLLHDLIKLAPYEIAEIKEVKEDIDGISSYANGIVKLGDIEDFTVTSDDIFCMSEEFIVTEPKRMFKREREYQVFLFETSILLTKKEKNEKNAIKYLYKDQIMLSDVFVVEHVDATSKIKFGLRKRNAGTVSSSDNTIIFKAKPKAPTDNASAEKIQQQWVKKLREFTVNIQHSQDPMISKKSSITTFGSNDNYYRSFRSPHSYTTSSRPSSSTTDPSSSNRNSRSSRDSCEIPTNSSTPATSNGHLLTVPGDTNNGFVENGHPTSSKETNHVGFRLSQWPKE